MTGVRARVLRNVRALGVVQAANYVVPIVVTPYVTRVIGLDLYGVVAFVQAIEGYLLIVTEFGFSLWGTRQAALLAREPNALGRVLASVLVVRVALLVPAALVMAVLAATVPYASGHALVFTLGFGYLLAQVFYLDWLFQGLEQLHALMWWTLAGRVGTMLLTFVLVRHPSDYWWVIALQVLGTVVASAGLWTHLVRVQGLRPKAAGMGDVRLAVAGGAPVFGARAFSVIYVAATPILGLAAAPAVVGLYALAERVVYAVVGLALPLTQATFPILAGLHRDAPARFHRVVWKYGAGIAALMSAGALALVLFAPQVVWVVSGEWSPLGATLLRLLAGVVVIGPLSALANQVLVILSKGRRLTLSTTVASCVFLMLVYPVLRGFGAPGLAVLVLGCQGLALGIAAWGARDTPRPSPAS